MAPVLLQLLSLLLYNAVWNFGLYGLSTLLDCDWVENGGVQSRSSSGDVGLLNCFNYKKKTKNKRIYYKSAQNQYYLDRFPIRKSRGKI